MQEKQPDITEVAKKQRHLFLLQKVKQGKQLTPREIVELGRYEKKKSAETKIKKPAKKTAKLTDKREAFCREYIIDLNGTQAAIRAKFSKKTAYSQGQRLLKNVDVQQQIRKLMAGREKRTEITADSVLKELAKIGFSNIGDHVRTDVSQSGQVEMKLLEELTAGQLACVSEITEFETERGLRRFKFKLHDKIKALELIGKHLGMFDGTGGEDSTQDVPRLVKYSITPPKEKNKK